MVRQVQAELVYTSRFTKDDKKHWVEGGVSNPRSNFEDERHTTNIVNVAADECAFKPTLDSNGFEFVTFSAKEEEFKDDSIISREYYKEVKDFILSRYNAAEVVIFDHTVRRPGTSRGPVPRTHVDQTEKAALARVQRHASTRLPGIKDNKRFQLINVWRPISHPAWNSPLAFCDYKTLGAGDMIETDRIDFEHLEQPPGETYSVAFNAQQNWYYYKDMKQEQVVLIKCYDSEKQVGMLLR